MHPANSLEFARLAAAVVLATTLALAGTGCRRAVDAPAAAPAESANSSGDPGAAAAKATAVPLPHPSTPGLGQGTDAIAAPLAATPAAAQEGGEPGAEGALHGLADADSYLQRLRATLAAESDSLGNPGALAKTGELLLRRERAGAEVADRLVATSQRVSLRTAGVAGLLARGSSGCSAAFHESAADVLPSACPAEADDALALAAGWAVLARTDLLEGLRVEAFQASDDITLRLAVPAWHLRWLVHLDRRGALRGIDLPARQLTMRWGPNDQGRRTAIVHRKGQLLWRWQVGASPGRAQQWQVAAPPSQEPLTSWAAVGALGDALQQALVGAQAVRLGAMTLQLQKTAGGYRVKGLSAPVLAAAQMALPAGVQLAPATAAGPVLAQGDPVKQTPPQLLSGRSQECLLVTIAVPHPSLSGGETAQAVVQACESTATQLR